LCSLAFRGVFEDFDVASGRRRRRRRSFDFRKRIDARKKRDERCCLLFNIVEKNYFLLFLPEQGVLKQFLAGNFGRNFWRKAFEAIHVDCELENFLDEEHLFFFTLELFDKGINVIKFDDLHEKFKHGNACNFFILIVFVIFLPHIYLN
jgi:hypothetical protein